MDPFLFPSIVSNNDYYMCASSSVGFISLHVQPNGPRIINTQDRTERKIKTGPFAFSTYSGYCEGLCDLFANLATDALMYVC